MFSHIDVHFYLILRKFLNRLIQFLDLLPLVKNTLNRLSKFLNRLIPFFKRLPLVKKNLNRLRTFLIWIMTLWMQCELVEDLSQPPQTILDAESLGVGVQLSD